MQQNKFSKLLPFQCIFKCQWKLKHKNPQLGWCSAIKIIWIRNISWLFAYVDLKNYKNIIMNFTAYKFDSFSLFKSHLVWEKFLYWRFWGSGAVTLENFRFRCFHTEFLRFRGLYTWILRFRRLHATVLRFRCTHITVVEVQVHIHLNFED